MKLHPSIFVGPVLILVVIAYFAGLMVVVPPASAQLPPIVFTNDVDPGTPGVQPVLVTPDSVNASARYTIGFYTDTGLFIEELGAQRIVITFPAGTKIPGVMTSFAVSVNGLKSFGVTVTGQTVKIATPEAIPPESDVTVVFETAAGIINPSIGGTYGTTFSKRPLSVSTSQQTFPVVPVAGYTISPILSVDKATASAGDAVTVSGVGFPAFFALTALTIGGVPVLPLPAPATDLNGGFATSVVVPALPAGPQAVAATAGGVSGETSLTIIIVSVSVTPGTAVPDQDITVSGSGFAPGATVAANSISIGGVTSAEGQPVSHPTVTIDDNGNFLVAYNVPNEFITGTPGAYSVAVTDSAGRTGSAPLTIRARALTLDPRSSRIGSAVLARGSGFPARSTMDLYYAGVSTAAFVSDAVGSFSILFTVPVTAAIPSSNTVAVTATSRAFLTKDAVHNVPPAAITLDRVSATPGERLTVNGVGFSAFSTIETLTIGGIPALPSPAPITSRDGAFTASVLTPALPEGAQGVTVADGQGVTGFATLNIVATPNLSLSPISGPRGTPVSVSATGLIPGSTVASGGITIGQTAWNQVPITVSPSGRLAPVTLIVPIDAPYRERLVAVTDGSRRASSIFEVTRPAISISPTSGGVGTVITVLGSGWPADGLVTITQDGKAVSSVLADASGNVTGEVTVPPALFRGGDAFTVNIGAADGPKTGNAAIIQGFAAARATITLSASSALTGQTISVKGAGFQTFASLTRLSIGGESLLPLSPVRSSNLGAWAASFRVPDLSGPQTVTITLGGVTRTAGMTVNTEADLAISTRAAGDAEAGREFTFLLDLANLGPSSATGVAVSNTLPASTVFVSASDGGVHDGNSPGAVMWSGLKIVAGGSRQLSVTVHLDSTVSGELTNTVQVLRANERDPNSRNNRGAVRTPVISLADLYVVDSLTDGAEAGQDITFQITIGNDGPSAGTGISVTDSLPEGASFVSASDGGVHDGASPGAVTWSGLSVPAGGSRTLSVTVRLGFNVSGSLINAVRILNSNERDPNLGNDQGFAIVAVIPQADLAIVSAATGDAEAGQDVTFRIIASNAGPSAATGVAVTDSLPAGTTFVSASAGGVHDGANPGTVTWPAVAVAAAGSETLSVTVRLDSSASGSLTNNVHIAGAAQSDPNTSNNDFSERLTITPSGGFDPLVGGIGIAALALGAGGLIFTLQTTLYHGGGWAIRAVGRLTLNRKRREQEEQPKLHIQPNLSISQTLVGTLWGLLAGGGSLVTLRETVTSVPTVTLVFEAVVPLTAIGFLAGMFRLVRR